MRRHARSSAEALVLFPVSSWRRRGRLLWEETGIILVQVCAHFLFHSHCYCNTLGYSAPMWLNCLRTTGILCGTKTMKKRKKMMYLTSKNAGLCVVFTKLEESKWRHVTHQAFASPWLEFDRYELQIYEEVAKMPPFQRKTLVLIGAQGVGRRSLKNRLIFMNPLRYGTTVPCEYKT